MGRFICPKCKGPVEFIPGRYKGEKRLYCRRCGKTLTQVASDMARGIR
jgi:uncharacterized protein YbaR (Trm112 family)